MESTEGNAPPSFAFAEQSQIFLVVLKINIMDNEQKIKELEERIHILETKLVAHEQAFSDYKKRSERALQAARRLIPIK